MIPRSVDINERLKCLKWLSIGSALAQPLDSSPLPQHWLCFASMTSFMIIYSIHVIKVGIKSKTFYFDKHSETYICTELRSGQRSAIIDPKKQINYRIVDVCEARVQTYCIGIDFLRSANGSRFGVLALHLRHRTAISDRH